MSRKLLFGLVLVMLFVMLSGCSKSGTATVTGYVMAPNGKDPVVGATVSVKGKGISTTTNGAGQYTLTNVPTGNQTLLAVKGNFKAEVAVNVGNAGVTVEAPAAKLTTKKIGVVTGSFDDIGAVLESLGLAYTEIGTHVLSEETDLDDYSVIFMACGNGIGPLDPNNPEKPEDKIIYDNLRTFVANGGGIYGSDWAAGTICSLFHDYISLERSDGKDQSLIAAVLDNDIKALLGKSTCTVFYDIDGWAMIKVEDQDNVQVDIIGDPEIENDGGKVTDKPLLVELSHGSGTVIFTSFHNSEQITEDGMKIIKHLVFSL